MKEDIIFFEEGKSLTARIERDIDHHSAKPMREGIDRRLFERRPDVLVLDFSGVCFMDSSGLGLILGRVEKAGALGATVRVCGLSPHLLKLVRLSGIERVPNLTLIK